MDTDAGDVVEERVGRTRSHGYVEEDARGRGSAATPESAGFVHEDTDPFVARPSETESDRFLGDQPVRLGDGNGRIVEANDGVEDSVRKTRGEGEHVPFSVAIPDRGSVPIRCRS